MAKNEIGQFLASLAEDLKKAAQTSKEEAHRLWPSSSSSDREMRKVAARDAKEILAVASLLKSGQVSRAHDRASGLDTIVRESIPDRFWDFVESVRRLSQ